MIITLFILTIDEKSSFQLVMFPPFPSSYEPLKQMENIGILKEKRQYLDSRQEVLFHRVVDTGYPGK